MTKIKDSSCTEVFQFELVTKFHLVSPVRDVKDKGEQFKAAVKEAAITMIGFKQCEKEEMDRQHTEK